MDAFDADVLIYASIPGHPLGRRVMALFPPEARDAPVGVGSVLLVPELLSKPMDENAVDELEILNSLLSRLELLPATRTTGQLATQLRAKHRLRTVDAVHLATAIEAGADRFLTNNQRDFGRSISEVEIIDPSALPDPASND